MSSLLQPLSTSNRDRNIDILRGFALAGVLFMFCVSDNGPSYGYTNSLSDEIISWFKYIFIESRMYTMLIIIFGIGFHVQLEKAKQQNESLVPVFTRRIIGLLVIGFIHAVILSRRDILMFYGAAGIILLLVRNASVKQLLLFMGILFYVLVPLMQRTLPNAWPKAAALVEPNEYRQYLQYNWKFFKYYHQVYGIYTEMLFFFMLGFVISKSGIFQKIKTDAIFRKRLLIAAIVATVVFIPFWYYLEPNILEDLWNKVTNKKALFFLALAYRTLWELWMLTSATLYGILLIILASKIKGKKILTPLASFGQMALSNYLIQSLVLVPYLLLTDKIRNLGPTEGLITFIIVITGQLIFSQWWMSKYKLGPFEWLLRSFTYWKWQPNRKTLQTEFNHEKQMVTVTSPWSYKNYPIKNH
jgi:uncharacterized protein